MMDEDYECQRDWYDRAVKILKDLPSDFEVVPALVAEPARGSELARQAFQDGDRSRGPCQCGDGACHAPMLRLPHRRLRYGRLPCCEYLFHDPLMALGEQQGVCLVYWLAGLWPLVSPLYRTTIQGVPYHGFSVTYMLIPGLVAGLSLATTIATLAYVVLALVQDL